MDVQLDNFVAVAVAGVRDFDRSGYGTLCGHFRCAQSDGTIFVSRITETVSEGIERPVKDIEIAALELGERVAFSMGTARILMVVIQRQLSDVAGEGSRQFCGGVRVAEQDVSSGVTAFGAGAPDVQDGVHVVVLPLDCERPAGHENHHDGLAGGFQRLE